MNKPLRLRRDLVALEAFTVSDVTGLLRKVFPSIASQFSSLKGDLGSDTPPIKLNGQSHDLVALLSAHKYTDIDVLTVSVPEGLKTTYLEYLGPLEFAVEHTSKVLGALDPFIEFLGQIVNSADERLSSTPIDGSFEAIAKEREAINIALGKCFAVGSSKAQAKYGSVVERNADWTRVFQKSSELVERIGDIPRAELNKKVATASALLNTVLTKLNRGDLDDVSPQVVKNLADGAYQAACEVEFYSVTYYKVHALAGALDRTTDTLLKTLKS